MSRVEFQRVLPTCLGFIPQKALEYLDKAAKQPTGDLTVLDAISYARTGTGDIYLILQDDTLCGAAFFMYGQGNNGRILDVALLGGEHFMQWRKEAHDFVINLAKSMNCKQIWLAGRKAWGNIFPDMKPIGVIYCLQID